MQAVTWQSLNVRVPGALIEAISRIAEERGLTVSEWVRSVLQSQLDLDPQIQRHKVMLYEVAKTRAVLLQMLNRQLTQSETDRLLELAEEIATEYVQEQTDTDNAKV